MKISSEESNVPIQAEDNIPERLELTGLRSLIDDEYELRGLGQRDIQDETNAEGGKASQSKELGLSGGSSAVVKSISVTKKGSGSPKNSDDFFQSTLKRKNDDGSYFECMQNSYGFDDEGADAELSSANLCGCLSEGDRSMMPPPTKRFRYMRRNSFVIHRRKGQFSGTGVAIDAASLEYETRQRNMASESSMNKAILPIIQTHKSRSHRLLDSMNGCTYPTASWKERHEKDSSM